MQQKTYATFESTDVFLRGSVLRLLSLEQKAFIGSSTLSFVYNVFIYLGLAKYKTNNK